MSCYSDTQESCCATPSQCYICLQSDDDMSFPCKCPRAVHPRCLARWQLQSAGREEEKHCRFCNEELPDWRPILTPDNLVPAIPVVSVHYNGICYRLRVRPGAEGFENFRRQLQRITGLPMLECMHITFQCRAPDSVSQELCFKGISAFDAAIHCASISAAERLASTGGRKAPSGACPGAVTTAPAALVSSAQPVSESTSQQHSPLASGGSTSSRDHSTGTAQTVATAVPPASFAAEHSTTRSSGSASSSSSPELMPGTDQEPTLLHRGDSACIIVPAALSAGADPVVDGGVAAASSKQQAIKLGRVRDFLRGLFTC